jgi:mitochondrial fission protein ELM1
MRSVFSDLKKFDLKIIPEHDRSLGQGLVGFGQGQEPVQQNRVVFTEGALNLIDPEYLKERSENLARSGLLRGKLSSLTIGVLIGGESKNFSITTETAIQLIVQLKKIAQELDADILLSTSRRTAEKVEKLIKNQLVDYARCKLLVIANENNHPDVVGGILGLSSIIISSPESISMISEAVCAEKYVVVFNSGQLSAKHQRFLKNYQVKKYVYLEEVNNLFFGVKRLLLNKPQVYSPQDNLKVSEGLKKIL